ncbi:hypothetical protein Achl_0170 [Pseudarthrobacter chlorophenolicus A6]|uniref:Uncharacterized protein n=1 Tax=Pseudarthrobacter chlorophenolicus (strain ATCC 700700 / DSM 12829 / CIP 107037 / JCM 12360 / KCTC 9906 / NCIMB 13794 / A6) TaxID=452863 RepID=B8H913_PSECP|nr:hypothetical protein [Pseudarthrobacter chlorophenolicus]ACL38172.1 hypothetical protein Achl_0170 [Pseudarthrobacter chlorophenolicus A6]
MAVHLYTGRAGDALTESRNGHVREPENLMHLVNYAHALLFLGREEEALGLYAELVPRWHPGKAKTLGSIIANDLRLMRLSGVICAGMPAVDALLTAAT